MRWHHFRAADCDPTTQCVRSLATITQDEHSTTSDSRRLDLSSARPRRRRGAHLLPVCRVSGARFTHASSSMADSVWGSASTQVDLGP